MKISKTIYVELLLIEFFFVGFEVGTMVKAGAINIFMLDAYAF